MIDTALAAGLIGLAVLLANVVMELVRRTVSKSEARKVANGRGSTETATSEVSHLRVQYQMLDGLKQIADQLRQHDQNEMSVLHPLHEHAIRQTALIEEMIRRQDLR